MQEMMECYKSENYLAFYIKGRGGWESHTNGIGIRRKNGHGNGKQIITFGNGCGLSKLALERWAGRVLKRLDDGSKEDEAKLWILAKMREFRS